MVCELSCDCAERVDTEANSISVFEQLQKFFAEQVDKGVFKEIKPQKPYYIWSNREREKKWYATKWYQCKKCGCLWEFNYPDFPAKGFVRKYTQGNWKFIKR